MSDIRSITALALGLALATAATATGDVLARFDGPVVSTADERTGIDVTVYNRDLALVRETRTAELPAGRLTLEFRDVPARIREHLGGTGADLVVVCTAARPALALLLALAAFTAVALAARRMPVPRWVWIAGLTALALRPLDQVEGHPYHIMRRG